MHWNDTEWPIVITTYHNIKQPDPPTAKINGDWSPKLSNQRPAMETPFRLSWSFVLIILLTSTLQNVSQYVEIRWCTVYSRLGCSCHCTSPSEVALALTWDLAGHLFVLVAASCKVNTSGGNVECKVPNVTNFGSTSVPSANIILFYVCPF